MLVSISRQVKCGPLPRQRLASLLRATLNHYRPAGRELPRELSLSFVGASAMRRLNRQYRGEDRVTDVLSFDYGEIIICYPVAVRQSTEHSVSVSEEVALLFVHGLLHMLGYDHHRLRQRAVMRRAEGKVLGYSGLVRIVDQNSKLKTQNANAKIKTSFTL